MNASMDRHEDDLYTHVVQVVEDARNHTARSVNTAMVQAYWLIGQGIVEVEQKGKERAGYGAQLIERLSSKLKGRFGRGFSERLLWRVRQFYLTYPSGSALARLAGDLRDDPQTTPESGIRSSIEPAEILPTPSAEFASTPQPLFPPDLSWSHYSLLLHVSNPQARNFYEIEAVREAWSVRELERQMASLLFERLAKNRSKDEVLALAKKGQLIAKPQDVLKDPMVLEFLDLQERAEWHERDLEQAIIHRLGTFLLELGKGFCFIGRQKRITLDGDHFYIDLVLYNRLLRGFVLVDLKLGKLTHQDLGQMQMYVNYYDRFQRGDWESPTVGIVLCSEKNDAMVRITLPEDDAQIHAPSYQLYLPTEEELRAELVAEREQLEKERRSGA